MFQDNIIIQMAAIVSLLFMGAVLASTFITKLGFDHEVESPNIARAVMLVIILGLTRGAF